MFTIIGGHGFIGTAINVRLQQLGLEVWLPEKNDPQIFKRDLGRVIYCAGLTADYAQRPFDTVSAHVNVLSEILYRAKWDHLIYLSSTRVYDGLSGSASESDNIIVNPNNPRHFYDISKLMGESLCLQTARASIARLACVYQDEQDKDGFLSGLLRQVIKPNAQQIILNSSPAFARDYVYLPDVIDALLAIADSHFSAIYNVASGENTTNQAIFSKLENIFGLQIVCSQAAASVDSSAIINIEKMQTQFGWNPKKVLPTIEAILKERMR